MAIAQMALRMQALASETLGPDFQPVAMRIGLHVGPAVGGVCGGEMLR